MADHSDGRTYVAPGELRADLFELFANEPGGIDLLLAAPGLLVRQAEGHAQLAREPHRSLPAHLGFAYQRSFLEGLASQIDGLPQTPHWEALLLHWIALLREKTARVFHYRRTPLFSRLISRPEQSIVPAGPITRELGGRPPGLELDSEPFRRRPPARAVLVRGAAQRGRRHQRGGAPAYPSELGGRPVAP